MCMMAIIENATMKNMAQAAEGRYPYADRVPR